MNRSGVPEPNIKDNPKYYLCRKTETAIKINGDIEKPEWTAALWTDLFVDIEGDSKPIPAKQTRVKMLWDDNYLYFGALLEENEIWAYQTERDSVIFQDNDFEIFIDPDGDSHNYYEFEINARNTFWDLLLPKPYRDGGPAINGWDIKGIKTAVKIDGELNNASAQNKQWSVEIAMPWAALKECARGGRPPLHGDQWRINFSRVEWQAEISDGEYRRKINPETDRPYPEDNWVWSPMGIVNMHYPELWGIVQFMEDEGEYIPDPDSCLKRNLRQIYYKQRNYFAKHGRFTGVLKDLELDSEDFQSIGIEFTRGLFEAAGESRDGKNRWYIREDGLLWKEENR